MNPLTLLETLKLRDDYSPETLERQARNLRANQDYILALSVKIRNEQAYEANRELENE